MKKCWRKWSYEIPLAFGDALWEVLVVQFAEFLSRLAAGKEHFWHALHLAARLARLAIRLASAAIDRSITGISRLRERRTPALQAKPRISDRSDDDRGLGVAWGAFATV